MKRYLRDIGEHGFIRAIRDRFPMASAGDDAAVLSSLTTPLVSTDSFFEGTHFQRWWTTPDKLAVRLLEATLSDIAAMGGEPVSVVSAVMLPPEMELDWLMEFYRGLTSRSDCPVVGGETIRGDVFGVTLTVIGECGTKKPFLRSAVEPGDTIWVSGPLGRSLNSPELLETGRYEELTVIEKEQTELFLAPKARFDVVPILRNCGAEAVIDISDGLFSECEHLVRESGVGITVELEKVPIVPYAKGDTVAACSAGEDFELLFALPAGASPPGDGFHNVGIAGYGKGFVLTNCGKQIQTGSQGYDHFS
ncbi:MAG: thiamine-phosphate kinase [Candidatus Sabulitectum sp.]|nr:thiamine-phosphate kinase [Candidatus Sabulitectum sp.]